MRQPGEHRDQLGLAVGAGLGENRLDLIARGFLGDAESVRDCLERIAGGEASRASAAVRPNRVVSVSAVKLSGCAGSLMKIATARSMPWKIETGGCSGETRRE